MAGSKTHRESSHSSDFQAPEIVLTVRSHIRRLTTVHNSPMPSIDIAHQHLITARAIHTNKVQAGKETVDVLDWSGIVAGTRVAAGLDPFESTVCTF
jgi:hypothetical protein